LMTQPGETRHYSVADHVRAIYDHTRPNLFDFAIVNRTAVAQRLLRRYRAEGAEPVEPSLDELARMGLNSITGDFLRQDGVVRHDETRLSQRLLEEFASRVRR